MRRKKKLKLLDKNSPGVKAHEDINLLCCKSFLSRNLEFSPDYVKDLDDMVAKLELIENDVKNINIIKEIMRDWQDNKLSDRRALFLILQILSNPAYMHYQNNINKERK